MSQQGKSRVASGIQKCFDDATSKVAAIGSKTSSKSRQNSNIAHNMGFLAYQHRKKF
jgi:hypothetical protein